MITRPAMAVVLATLFPLSGCSRPSSTPKPTSEPLPAPAHEQTATGPAERPPTFVDRVWQVAESNGMSPGQLVVFLSEGTLVFASPHGTPSLGTWSREGDGLTMVEEGIPYRVDILELSETGFRIRSHNPGEPVETRFVPAAPSSSEGPERRTS